MTEDEKVAKLFHDTYERLAPEYGYQTRDATAVAWEDVPEPNRSLMIAVAGVVRARVEQEMVDKIAEIAKPETARWLELIRATDLGPRIRQAGTEVTLGDETPGSWHAYNGRVETEHLPSWGSIAQEEGQ